MRTVNAAVVAAAIALVGWLALGDGQGPRGAGPEPAVPIAAGPLRGRVVGLDPGHGGPDPGAVGPTGVLEKHVTLAVALRLKQLLEHAGATVFLTRDRDLDLSGLGPGASLRERWRGSLRRRVELINAWGVDVLVSVHANALPSRRWSGGQVFYSPRGHPLSEVLAAQLQRELIHITQRTRRAPSSHIEHYVLENVTMPAATVELGFLSNPEEERLLTDPAYQDRLAWALFIGLGRFFHETERPGPLTSGPAAAPPASGCAPCPTGSPDDRAPAGRGRWSS